ncbi:MAG: hypothetical protein KKD92_01395 [Proteobacteria bacterium]|nr:hypothetical protein [Pseudomonadota bacterium]
MLIRIMCLDELFLKMQRSNLDSYIAAINAAATASYADQSKHCSAGE